MILHLNHGAAFRCWCRVRNADVDRDRGVLGYAEVRAAKSRECLTGSGGRRWPNCTRRRAFYRELSQLSESGRPVEMDSAATALNAARGESVRAWKTYVGTTLTEAEIALVNHTTGPVAELHDRTAGSR